MESYKLKSNEMSSSNFTPNWKMPYLWHMKSLIWYFSYEFRTHVPYVQQIGLNSRKNKWELSLSERIPVEPDASSQYNYAMSPV